MSAMHMNLSRNKRSVTLNLARPEALEVLMTMAEGADVFVHSMRPAAARRLGIGYAAVRARNPRIIYASGPGYRQDGPKRDRPAYDDVLQGESGIAALMAQVNGVPSFYPTVLIDKLCGYVLASSVGMALYARERTGKGQEVQVPMYETALSFNFLEHLWGAAFDPPLGEGVGYVRLLTKHRNPYATADGFICVMAMTDEQWSRLLSAVGRADLVGDARFARVADRVKGYDELYGILAKQLATRTSAEWNKILDAADIPNGTVRSLQELCDDPYLKETGFFHHYHHPSEGEAVATSIPVHFSETPGTFSRAPPRLGEHNAEVFSELGLSAAQIARVVS